MFMKTVAAFSVASLLILSGCANSPQIPQDIPTQVAKACAVAQPTLASVQALTPPDSAHQAVLAKVVNDAGAICSAGPNIKGGSLKEFAEASVPAALKVLELVTLDPAVNTVQIGLVALQVAISAAAAQYAMPTTETVSASTPAAK